MVPFDLLHKVVEIFERLKIPYLVTGSVAAMAYGEPRFTNDIDIVAAIKEQHIPDLLAAFPVEEFYLDADMIKEAIRDKRQFNIIHPASGLKVDVMIRHDTAFDESRFSRIRRIQPAESYQANFAAPEDVIIKKMEYYQAGGSEKHLRDITAILLISGKSIDWKYLSHWAERLGLMEIWDAVKKRISK
ncbi:MAG: hypothetical protein HY920_04110 [Elusimicrobia bacterium]|nr:hypothetical protein [Elusimicrobiota bacterium]